MNSNFSKYLSYIALTGLIAGLIVHISAILGIDVSAQFPFVWILHLGIFIVWIPSIIKLIILQTSTPGFRENKNKFKMYKLIFDNASKPLLIVAAFFFVYAFINFFLFSSYSDGGGPSIIDGQYVLQNHGNIIKNLTFEEYQRYQANELRGFSGHWMAFYSLAFALLFPKNAQSENKKN